MCSHAACLARVLCFGWSAKAHNLTSLCNRSKAWPGDLFWALLHQHRKLVTHSSAATGAALPKVMDEVIGVHHFGPRY